MTLGDGAAGIIDHAERQRIEGEYHRHDTRGLRMGLERDLAAGRV